MCNKFQTNEKAHLYINNKKVKKYIKKLAIIEKM